MKVVSFLCILSLTLWAQSPVFTCNFDNEPLGTYTVSQMKAAWNNPTWNTNLDNDMAKIVEESGNKVLQVFYPANTFGSEGGVRWEMDLEKMYDTLWISYKIKFEDGFDYVRGGKLPGLGGGTTPTGGENTTGHDGFSARIMWRWKNTGDGEQGAMCQYVYHMDKPDTYGDNLYWAYPNYEWSSTRRYFVPGTWHTVKTRIIINTPGQFDGRITSWLDGDLGLDSLMRFRAEGETGFAVDKFLFSTFFGGGDTTWATTKDEYIYFDDFIISETDPDQTETISFQGKSERIPYHMQQEGKKLHLWYREAGVSQTLTITDLKGRLLCSKKENNGHFTWNYSDVPSGIYLLIVNDKLLTKIVLE